MCSCVCAKLLQLCLTLCDPVDYRPQGSSPHGIPQARILEGFAISFSGGSSPPMNQTGITYIYIGRQVLFH